MAEIGKGSRVWVRFIVNDECNPPYRVEGAALVRQVKHEWTCPYAITMESDGSRWSVDRGEVTRVLTDNGKAVG